MSADEIKLKVVKGAAEDNKDFLLLSDAPNEIAGVVVFEFVFPKLNLLLAVGITGVAVDELGIVESVETLIVFELSHVCDSATFWTNIFNLAEQLCLGCFSMCSLKIDIILSKG